MPYSYFYEKYLQSYDLYCNSMPQKIFAGQWQGFKKSCQECLIIIFLIFLVNWPFVWLVYYNFIQCTFHLQLCTAMLYLKFHGLIFTLIWEFQWELYLIKLLLLLYTSQGDIARPAKCLHKTDERRLHAEDKFWGARGAQGQESAWDSQQHPVGATARGEGRATGSLGQWRRCFDSGWKRLVEYMTEF